MSFSMEKLYLDYMQEVSTVRFIFWRYVRPANPRTFPFHYLVDTEYGWVGSVQLAIKDNGETDVNEHRPLKNNGMIYFSAEFWLNNHTDIF